MKKRRRILFLFVLLAGMYQLSFAQNKSVSGTVKDANNEYLIGVTVAVKGTADGTITNADGVYMLSGLNAGSTLVFSYIGYKTQEVKVENRTSIPVVLEEDKNLLDEVVVIGYGSMDKKELTSAIAHISSEDFLNSTGVDPSMMIQGKVAGVSITNTGMADPNQQASIQIRGVTSRAAGLGPLIVIDGIPGGNLTNINANDIASMDILKDGAASAIYGTRGSNGVILITTKKGSKDGKLHTSYNGGFTANVPIHELDLLSADQFRKYHMGAPNNLTDFGGDTNWLDEVTQTGLTHQHTLTLSGGNLKSNYRVSLDYKNAEGIDIRSGREEYGARASINHTTNSGFLSFSLNLAPRIAERKTASWDVFKAAADANPTTPVFNTGTLYTDMTNQLPQFNPMEKLNLEEDGGTTKLLDWDATVKLDLLPLWKDKETIIYALNTQLTYANRQADNFNYFFRPSTSNYATKEGYGASANRSYVNDEQRSLEWIGNLGIQKNGHKALLMGGYSYQYIQSSGLAAENKDFASDGLKYNDLGSGAWAALEGMKGMSSNKADSKLIAFFGRLSYDYQSKYLATASLRYEGSSKFGINNNWGYFPAVSAGWRISEEPFMNGMRWINELKIRGDYGVTGNQNFSNYRSLSTMGAFGRYFYEGTWFDVWGPSRNPNPNLKWELGKNYNFGLDFSLFNQKLNGSVNYYERHQQDLLGDYDVPIPPAIQGTTFLNVGTMKNSGLEMNVNVTAVKTKNFTYEIELVGATLENKFLKFSSPEYTSTANNYMVSMEGPNTPGYLQRLQEGERVGNFYTYAYAGIDSKGGWLVYNKDNTRILRIGDATDSDKRITGNGLPGYTASLTQDFSYKDWKLTVFLRGAFDYDIFNVHDFYYGLPSFSGNVLEKAYVKNKDITGSNVVTDYFIEPGDYVKLDMVTLSRTFNFKPGRVVEKVRIYVTGRNLATFTSFSGVDPANYNTNGLTPGATSTRMYYPQVRQIILGLQLDF